VLVSDALGGLEASLERRRLQVTVADLNRDGQPDLLATDDAGQLRVYPGFQAHLTGSFPVETNVFWQPQAQQYASAQFGPGMVLATGNLDQDQGMEVVVGTHAGGLRFLKAISEPLSVKDPQTAAAGTKIFPNPADKEVQVLTQKTATYQLLNVAGQRIRQGKTAAGQATVISTASLAPGIYFLRVQTADGSFSTHKLLIRH
jgi:hypothetical protein